MRGNKIAPLWHICLALLSTCAEGVQFYCPSRTYPAIPYCTIFQLLKPNGPSHTHLKMKLNKLLLKLLKNDVNKFSICTLVTCVCWSLHNFRFQKFDAHVCNPSVVYNLKIMEKEKKISCSFRMIFLDRKFEKRPLTVL